MDNRAATRSLAALGHEGRLGIFRLLAEAGPDGLAAGEVARRTGMLQNTCSSSLNVLSAAGLVETRRDGRSIIYAVAEAHFDSLLEFLVQDCGGGRPGLFASLFAAQINAADEIETERRGVSSACR